VKRSIQKTDGVTYGGGTDPNYWMTYSYNLSGALIEQQYPSGRVIKNVLDSDGELATVRSKKNPNHSFWNYANRFSYNAAGAVTSMQLGNGRWESTQFNERLQPTQIALGKTKDATDLLELDYQYGDLQWNGSVPTTSNNGNVAKQTITVAGVGTTPGFTAVQNYDYDQLNRIQIASETLTPTTGTPESWVQEFKYDRFGNRKFVEQTTTTLPRECGTDPDKFVCPDDPKINPSANPNNNKLTGYTFDAAGNTKLDAQNRRFFYDAENKLTKVITVDGNETQIARIGEYSYDGDGKRVKKRAYENDVLKEETIFVYDAAGKLIGEYSNEVASQQEAKVAYLTNDHLGSPRINTDANGAVTSRHDYHPFGEEIASPKRVAIGYADDTVRKQFTGYERDDETDLDYAQARMYNSKHGRFTSTDPLLTTGRPSNPKSWNRYVYTLNNPLKLIDPSGLYEFAANATNDQKKQFRQALKGVEAARDKFKVGSTKYNRLNDALTSYGKEVVRDANGKVISGDQNGVSVTFDKFKGKDKDIGGRTSQPDFKYDESTGKTTANLTVTINTSILNKQNELAVVTAHEGQHVADAQALAGLDFLKDDIVNNPLNRNQYQLEVRGYEITSFMLEAQGNEDARYDGVQLWSKGWKEPDGQAINAKRGGNIDKFLEKSSSYPNSKPSNQGRRYVEP
jgi:RHS repeat-associated protein